MTDTKFWDAAEPREIAEELIANGWEELHGHDLADIRHVFTNTEAGKDGCKVMANTRKLPGLQSALLFGLADEARTATVAQPIFVIVYSGVHWGILDPKEKRALVHHELAHIDPIEGKVRPHFVEEHYTTYRRFGKWRKTLQMFGEIEVDG